MANSRLLTGRSALVVTEADCADAMGSGSLPVLATPVLVALMENAAMTALDELLPEGATSVGSYIAVEHIAPTAVGEGVTACATLTAQEGSRFTFDIEAKNRVGEVVGKAVHKRVAVVAQRFLERLG